MERLVCFHNIVNTYEPIDKKNSVVRQENEREDQGEGVQSSGKTSTDVGTGQRHGR